MTELEREIGLNDNWLEHRWLEPKLLPLFDLQFSTSFLHGVASSFLPVLCLAPTSQTATQNARAQIAHTLETTTEHFYKNGRKRIVHNFVDKGPFWPLVNFTNLHIQFFISFTRLPKSSFLPASLASKTLCFF